MPDHPAAKHPFLVVVRGGVDALCQRWMRRDLPRKWDLLVDWYGPDTKDRDEFGDFIHRGGTSKFLSIKKMDTLWPGYFQSYEAVWFVDGDIDVEFGDIDLMFDIFCSNDLWLAQPSLSPTSFFNHDVCVNRSLFLLRYVNFVEVMAPIFSRVGLEKCLSTFDCSVSGWGLDFVWPVLLGEPRRRMAIIDAIQIVHTKELDLEAGAFYRFLRSIGVDPFVEMEAVMRKFGARRRFLSYGWILK